MILIWSSRLDDPQSYEAALILDDNRACNTFFPPSGESETPQQIIYTPRQQLWRRGPRGNKGEVLVSRVLLPLVEKCGVRTLKISACTKYQRIAVVTTNDEFFCISEL